MLRAKVYLPEIHDLYPGMDDKLERMIGAFPESAQPHIVYSVVPDWMGAEPLTAAPDFARKLAGLPGTLALHGLTHTQGEDLLNWVLYGHENRSEFAGLSAEDTGLRLDAGLEIFAVAGLPRPTWFCAPRWTPSPSLNAALFDRGFDGVLARDGFDLPNRQIPVPPLNFDEGERAWKIGPGRLLREGVINRMFAAERPFRLVLHPDDLKHPKTFAQFQRTVARLEAEGWAPTSLEELLT